MSERLDGTVALITGASSGIGSATARALAARGAAVALVARREGRLEQLAEDIRGDAGGARVLTTDVSNKAQAQAAVARTVRELGRLDILVNSAGVPLVGPIVGASLEDWEQVVLLNLLGVLYTTYAALSHLLTAAADGPCQVADLVNISSVSGRVARSSEGVYDRTKFGVAAFSESLRQEVTRRHAHVAVVEPGVVATEILSHSHVSPEVREQAVQQCAGFEPLAAEDIAASIAYTVTRPPHVAVNEILIHSTEQEA